MDAPVLRVISTVVREEDNYLSRGAELFPPLLSAGAQVKGFVSSSLIDAEEGQATLAKLSEVGEGLAKYQDRVLVFMEAMETMKKDVAAQFKQAADAAAGADGRGEPPQMDFEALLQEHLQKASSKRKHGGGGSASGGGAMGADLSKLRKLCGTAGASAAAADAEDEELEVVEQDGGAVKEADLKCPLTAALLVDPVKSKKCGHTFSRKAIEAHIGRKQQNTCVVSRGSRVAPPALTPPPPRPDPTPPRCPVFGCVQTVGKVDLVVDKEKAFALERMRRLADEDAGRSGGEDGDGNETDSSVVQL